MKHLAFMLLAIFLSLNLFTSCKKNQITRAELIPSRVDSINTAEEVKSILVRADTNMRSYHVGRISKMKAVIDDPRDSMIKQLAIEKHVYKSFYKSDLDHNGYTDLLVMGGWPTESSDQEKRYWIFPIVLMNFGKDSLNIVSLEKEDSSAFLPMLSRFGTTNGITLYKPEHIRFRDTNRPTRFESTNLVYKYGGFIEYAPKKENVQPIHIEKIEFAAWPCYGTCPMYQMIIDSDRRAYFIASHFNFDRTHAGYTSKEEGVFITTVLQNNYNKLSALLDDINFTHLTEEYTVRYTDAPSATLRITYNNGKIKTIRDYGKVGSYGLMTLYKMFDELRFNQEWKPCKEPKGIRLND